MSMSEYLYCRSDFIDTFGQIDSVGDAKTATLSEFPAYPAYRGTKMKCYEVKVPAKVRMGGGGAGVSNDWCIINVHNITL